MNSPITVPVFIVFEKCFPVIIATVKPKDQFTVSV